MSKQVLVKTWMGPVKTVKVNTPLRRAVEIMRQADVQCLIVLANNDIVGIITMGDIRAALPGDDTTRTIWDINNTWEHITVRQLMSDRVITIRPHANVVTAASVMLRNNVSRLPVVDRHGRLVGIISSFDIYRMLAQTRQDNIAHDEVVVTA